MDFTYYGDLLGVSSFYRLSPEIAYRRINDFYETSFNVLNSFLEKNKGQINVVMFSDSILMWGSDVHGALIELHCLYNHLLTKGLYLRGAMVDGKLLNDPRFELKNYKNSLLPSNDTLARAVGLEKTQKGARFLIENKLAQKILTDQYSDWLLNEGYIQNPSKMGSTIADPLRRIAPTPDCIAYEFLYFWSCPPSIERTPADYLLMRKQLDSASKMTSRVFAEHYEETLELLKRCEERQNFTKEQLPAEYIINPS